MTQPQKFSREFQREVATAKVFHHEQFTLFGIRYCPAAMLHTCVQHSHV